MEPTQCRNCVRRPELLIDTLKSNFDLDIDHYAQIKFDDFKEIIDIIGGVDLTLTAEEVDYINQKLHDDDKDYSNDIQEESGTIHLTSQRYALPESVHWVRL